MNFIGRGTRLIMTVMLAVGVLAPASLASAQNTKQSVTISPFLQEVRIEAGDATKDFTLSLTNRTGSPQVFRLTALDFGSLNDTGGVVFAGSNASSLIKKYGLANWLTLSSKEVPLDSNKTAKITATIINDTSLSPGGHYGAVVASIDSTDDATNQIAINQQLSSLIFATKVGGEKYDLKLGRIVPQGGKFRLPKAVVLHFMNPGNVHVIPRGKVRILAAGGKVISEGVINEDSSFVLPETTRQIPVEMRAVGRAGIWPSAYQIQADYRYDGIDVYARKEQRLYFVNAVSIALIITALAGLVFAVYTYRGFLKKMIRKAYRKKA